MEFLYPLIMFGLMAYFALHLASEFGSEPSVGEYLFNLLLGFLLTAMSLFWAVEYVRVVLG